MNKDLIPAKDNLDTIVLERVYQVMVDAVSPHKFEGMLRKVGPAIPPYINALVTKFTSEILGRSKEVVEYPGSRWDMIKHYFVPKFLKPYIKITYISITAKELFPTVAVPTFGRMVVVEKVILGGEYTHDTKDD